MERMKTVEWHDDRWYKREKQTGVEYYASVTTKLGIIEKSFLGRWRGDLGNREADWRLKDAQNRGKRIHHAWEFANNGGIVLYNPYHSPKYTPEQIKDLGKPVFVIEYPDEMVALWRLQKLQQIVKPKVLHTELNVYSDTHREAGTIDAVWEITAGIYPINGKVPLKLPGGIYVVDLKTGNTFSDDAYMQTAAYASMFVENGYTKKVVGTLGIHTEAATRTGIEGLATHYHDESEVAQDYKHYRVASDLWLIKHKDDQPKIFDFPSMIAIDGVIHKAA